VRGGFTLNILKDIVQPRVEMGEVHKEATKRKEFTRKRGVLGLDYLTKNSRRSHRQKTRL